MESQPIYWSSLASVPQSILHRLRKLLFNFLWNGNVDSSHYHLCHWETLTHPKSYGGWGLRNIFSFSKSLAASTFWRVLTKQVLWQKVLKEKYFSFMTVKNWLRSATFQNSLASKIWNSLLKAIPLITNWLSWNPGTGHHVALGREKILGLGTDSYLSNSLINALSQKHVSVLAQVWKPQEHDTLVSTWYIGSEFELTGNLAKEWDRFKHWEFPYSIMNMNLFGQARTLQVTFRIKMSTWP
jgi:hypothetical protein